MPGKIDHIFIDNIEHKWCGQCKEYVVIAQFGKETKKRDGLKCICKPCSKIFNKKYREIHGKEIDKKTGKKERTMKNIARNIWNTASPMRKQSA